MMRLTANDCTDKRPCERSMRNSLLIRKLLLQVEGQGLRRNHRQPTQTELETETETERETDRQNERQSVSIDK